MRPSGEGMVTEERKERQITGHRPGLGEDQGGRSDAKSPGAGDRHTGRLSPPVSPYPIHRRPQNQKVYEGITGRSGGGRLLLFGDVHSLGAGPS